MKFMVTTGRPHTDPEDETGVASEPSLEELVGLLFRLTGDLRQLFSERSADLDLTFSQAMALHELDQPLLMRELPQRLCCDASNVTGIVDRLEARGLVERQLVPVDRRVRHLVLTDAGRTLRELHRESLTIDLPLLDLSSEERCQLGDLLRRAVGGAAPGFPPATR